MTAAESSTSLTIARHSNTAPGKPHEFGMSEGAGFVNTALLEEELDQVLSVMPSPCATRTGARAINARR